MRDQKTRWVRFLSVLGSALAVSALLALGSIAASARAQTGPGAGRDGVPVSFLELDKIEPGAGVVVDTKQAATGSSDFTFKTFLGLAGFSFPETSDTADATDRVTTTKDGSRFSVLAQSPSPDLTDPQAPRGGISHFEELQAYRKRSSDATLRITITQAVLRAIDERRDASGCPPKTVSDCPLLRGVILFRARAYAASAGNASGGDFFTEGGVASLEGHRGHWTVSAATDADSQSPLWDRSSFRRTDTCKSCVPPRAGGPAIAAAELRAPVTLTVPLDSVRDNELFAVDVTLEAEATNDRGGESTSMGFIEDPEHVGPGLLKTHGLKPLGKPKFREPKLASPPAATCPAGPSPHAGELQLSRGAYAVTEDDRTPMVLVTRTGGSHGEISATVRTKSGSAKAGQDFQATTTRVTFGNGDTSPRLVEIPISEDQGAESQENFTVSLSHPECGRLGKQRQASVTILDDDQPPPPPPSAFTVGGTVDGLAGGGLVLVNQTTVLPVTGNGSFTFPGTFPDGTPYDVRVQAQPTNPDQVCSVVDGTGTLTANVSNVAVHCANVPIPTGLDSSFGLGGRVTTPGGGDARAVLVRPDGGIIAVGRRDVAATAHSQFGAAGYDSAGNLDPGFGTGGIVTTGLGGNDDEAFDAALLPGGGFVAVGQADPAGLVNTDFGVVRYTPHGHPDPAFNTTGIETTDLTGRGDAARAVAVQPDGKIVAAGFAQTSPINFDFALVRYNTDGTLDHSFGGDGIVTTDIGDLNDVANALAIQPDGSIVAVGNTGENIALARYLPGGQLDPTFNAGGIVVSDLGFDDVANGVAITPAGTILIAGTRLGPHVNLDPYIASYSPNGKLNLGFGNLGIADTDLSGGDDFGDDLALDAAGRIVLVGYASSSTVTDMALVRFTPEGTLDTSLTTDFHGTGDFGHALTIDPQGRIVAAGSSGDQFALMRANL